MLNEWNKWMDHHHHHLFLKRPFLPRSARVRRSSRNEASPNIPEHCPFRKQSKPHGWMEWMSKRMNGWLNLWCVLVLQLERCTDTSFKFFVPSADEEDSQIKKKPMPVKFVWKNKRNVLLWTVKYFCFLYCEQYSRTHGQGLNNSSVGYLERFVIRFNLVLKCCKLIFPVAHTNKLESWTIH